MFYSNKKFFSIALLIFFSTIQHISAQSKDTLKVLFVGNSYTYFWNMPLTVSAMAATQGKSIMARKSTAGGAYLMEHWDGKKGLKTREVITHGAWDIVVLQNQSLSTIEKYNRFMEYGKRFIRLVKKSGAVPMLYITWARQYNPLMQKKITKAYKTLADETGVKTVPVGPIWKQVRTLRPDLRLFHADGSHPSNIGSYLIACVFYAMLTGSKTSSLPERITTTDKNGEKLYLSILMKSDADFIHQAVDEYLFPETTEEK